MSKRRTNRVRIDGLAEADRPMKDLMADFNLQIEKLTRSLEQALLDALREMAGNVPAGFWPEEGDYVFVCSEDINEIWPHEWARPDWLRPCHHIERGKLYFVRPRFFIDPRPDWRPLMAPYLYRGEN